MRSHALRSRALRSASAAPVAATPAGRAARGGIWKRRQRLADLGVGRSEARAWKTRVAMDGSDAGPRSVHRRRSAAGEAVVRRRAAGRPLQVLAVGHNRDDGLDDPPRLPEDEVVARGPRRRGACSSTPSGDGKRGVQLAPARRRREEARSRARARGAPERRSAETMRRAQRLCSRWSSLGGARAASGATLARGVAGGAQLARGRAPERIVVGQARAVEQQREEQRRTRGGSRPPPRAGGPPPRRGSKGPMLVEPAPRRKLGRPRGRRAARKAPARRRAASRGSSAYTTDASRKAVTRPICSRAPKPRHHAPTGASARGRGPSRPGLRDRVPSARARGNSPPAARWAAASCARGRAPRAGPSERPCR